MNGYDLMLSAITCLALIAVFMLVHHGPTGIMRGLGLWLIETADSTDSRWLAIQDKQRERIRRAARFAVTEES